MQPLPEHNAQPWWLLVVLLGALSGACRTDERATSGQPYSCVCILAGEQELEVAACAITTGEATVIARECAAAAQQQSVQLCSCWEDTTLWCEIGECSVR